MVWGQGPIPTHPPFLFELCFEAGVSWLGTQHWTGSREKRSRILSWECWFSHPRKGLRVGGCPWEGRGLWG